jgi:hypothetical protein
MLYERTKIATALEAEHLPLHMDELFGDLYDRVNSRFLLQETTLLDFKESIPISFSDGYGTGIVRLALALHNTYGGFIIFGVVDKTLTISKTADIFNIEAFNRYLSDVTGSSVECQLRRYIVDLADPDKTIQVVMVPRRTVARPLRLIKQAGKYLPGTLWIRDRHEVLEARSEHLPLLYSDRTLFLEKPGESISVVHRSLPTSPATMEEFIGRGELMIRLWDWVTSGDQPRLYLHGPGGSGKSTLAYAFARSVAEAPHAIRGRTGSALDYVIYLTGKETAFDPLLGQSDEFLLRDFCTSTQQFRKILFHSGMASEDEILSFNDQDVEDRLDELFANFTGLIIVDDIDALSRTGEDTGEESLLLRSVRAGTQTKILYTSRYAPAYALKNAVEVPGLRGDTEYIDFIESCCNQFGVAAPEKNARSEISRQTDNIPLLIETIIGLRRTCSSYEEALSLYKNREGDSARRYLYQREYDKLDAKGRSRQLLCALALLEEPTSTGSISHIASMSESQIRDSITETKGIFLRTTETTGGDTLYGIAQSALHFVQQISKNLSYYGALDKAVQHFKRQSIKSSSREAAIITGILKLARAMRFDDIIEEVESIPQDDVVWGNPRFLGLVGQAYAWKGGPRTEDARECFRRAFALHDRDIFMLRAWYKLEVFSPNGCDGAEIICKNVLRSEIHLERRYLSEFHSKLGQVLEIKSRQHIYTNRERAIALLKESISSYFEGIWLSRGITSMNKDLQLEWATDSIRKLYSIMGNDVDHIFDIVELWAQSPHDVDIDAARILIEPLRGAAATAHPAAARLAGLARKGRARFVKLKVGPPPLPGFSYVADALQDIIGGR